MAKSPFFDGVSEFNIGFINANEQAVRGTSIKVFALIIDESPVKDGRFRANWQLTGKSPSVATVNKEDKSGAATKAKVIKQIIGMKDWSSFMLTNNLPYAQKIEFGLYPNPPKNGTWVKAKGDVKGHYEINTKNGYSSQAPRGLVRVNIAKAKRLLEEEAAKGFKKL